MQRKTLLQQISDSFPRLKRAMHTYLSEDSAKRSLSPAQLAILRSILYSQPISHKDLASQMQLTPGAISQFIDGLYEADCIVRTADETDRRVSYLSVSRNGKQLLQEHQKQQLKLLSQATTPLSDEDLQTYVRVHETIIDWFETKNQSNKETK